ncbi:hypothetical protein PX554_19710 [Sphingomonas sp. H39-1-10]|uniref:hypothetical protein n=1 Tax=Sphingomonas pollutisoli TaxID=3030829 RepID=UPI0023B96E6A|nr:hypothetical protein [Sphingomonas pollutisoli]MDF0490358.1 hypothetical protein [Sphingomonas pollutisoli]
MSRWPGLVAEARSAGLDIEGWGSDIAGARRLLAGLDAGRERALVYWEGER